MLSFGKSDAESRVFSWAQFVERRQSNIKTWTVYWPDLQVSRPKETELPQLQDMRVKLDADAWHDAPDEILNRLRSSQWDLLIIDATDAKPAGAQVAQLLLSAQKTSVETNRELRIEHASSAFKSSLQALGLFDALEGSII